MYPYTSLLQDFRGTQVAPKDTQGSMDIFLLVGVHEAKNVKNPWSIVSKVFQNIFLFSEKKFFYYPLQIGGFGAFVKGKEVQPKKWGELFLLFWISQKQSNDMESFTPSSLVKLFIFYLMFSLFQLLLNFLDITIVHIVIVLHTKHVIIFKH